MFRNDPEAELAVLTLDKYNFTALLRACYGVNVSDIAEALGEYGEDVREALKDLSDYQLAKYLSTRYVMRTEEVTEYYVWSSSLEKSIRSRRTSSEMSEGVQ